MARAKPGLVDRVKDRFEAARQRWPMLEHAVATVQHYIQARGNVLAGAVTYFGFLSFFPILALAFSVIGYVALAFPDARDQLVEAIEQVFPGIVTVDGGDGTIGIDQVEDASGTVGTIGFVALLYTGLGWLSGLRKALAAAFELPREDQRNFVVGKAVDLVVLGLLGVVLIVSVGVSGVAKGLADEVLRIVSLEDTAAGLMLIWSVTTVLGLAASTVLFFVMFRVLGRPELPDRPLWQGAVLGAVGFELLKVIVVNILGGVGGSAFAPLAIAVTLIVWINYFSRLVFVGASWAVTSPLSAGAIEERREVAARDVLGATAGNEGKPAPDHVRGVDRRREEAERTGGFDIGSALLGGVAGAVAASLLRRRG